MAESPLTAAEKTIYLYGEFEKGGDRRRAEAAVGPCYSVPTLHPGPTS